MNWAITILICTGIIAAVAHAILKDRKKQPKQHTCDHCNQPIIQIGRNENYIFYKCGCNRNKGADYDWKTALIDGVEYELGDSGSLIYQCQICLRYTFRVEPSNEVCLFCGLAIVKLCKYHQ